MTELVVPSRVKNSGIESIYETNAWLIFGGICFVYLLFNWYLRSEVLTDQVYYYSLGRSVSAAKLGAFLEAQHDFGILSYLVVPVTLMIKTVLVSFTIFTGLLLTSNYQKFRTIVRIVLFAESAFALSALLKLLLLVCFVNVQSLAQYESFAPLSLYSLFRAQSVPYWLIYPLQTVDVFQVGYILLLGTGLRYYTGRNFRNAVKFVLATYGTGLLCCMIGFAFLTFILSNHS